jgi:hypothetical protein
MGIGGLQRVACAWMAAYVCLAHDRRVWVGSVLRLSWQVVCLQVASYMPVHLLDCVGRGSWSCGLRTACLSRQREKHVAVQTRILARTCAAIVALARRYCQNRDEPLTGMHDMLSAVGEREAQLVCYCCQNK